MLDQKRLDSEPSLQRQMALSRWDNEGGAGFGGPQKAVLIDEEKHEVPELTNAELVQLQVRVIALENLVIALLAGASDRQLDLAHEMSAFICPRPGFTQHQLTVQAAAHMVGLVQRANRFSNQPPSPTPYKLTAVFDEISLPAGFRREHRTKPGVWGVIRVLDGQLRYQVLDPSSEMILEPGRPGLIHPEEPHRVEPIGRMRMQVEFYDRLPDL